MNINAREKELDDLDIFIKSKQEILNSVLDSLGWTEESLNDEDKVHCPVNSNHWIPEHALLHHEEICKCAQDGYRKEDLDKQPPDSTFFYEKAQNVVSVKLDESTLKKVLLENGLISESDSTSLVIPKTVDRWTVQFNPEQRLSIYDYIISASKIVEKQKNVTLEDLMIDFEKKEHQDEKPKSKLEILAEMRDYKRRRQSYRAKNVHITKKSYTEIMKEVIENQTNYLMEMNKLENSENLSDEESHGRKRKRCHDDTHSNSSDSINDHHRKHDSHHKSPKHHSLKKKKHKRDHSRSRSPSHHKHKKSHKRKRSRD